VLPHGPQQEFVVDIIKQAFYIELQDPIIFPASLTRNTHSISPSKTLGSNGDGQLNGRLPWANSPFSSVHAFQDRPDDSRRRKQPSPSVARVWPTNNPCEGWRLATRLRRAKGLDRGLLFGLR
jgi:hypothetical protein